MQLKTGISLLDKGMPSANVASSLPQSPLCMVLIEMHSLPTIIECCEMACGPSHAAILQ